MKEAEIRELFERHLPDQNSVLQAAIREFVTDATVRVAELLPPSRERSLFITLMQQAQMMAHAAIAIHGD